MHRKTVATCTIAAAIAPSPSLLWQPSESRVERATLTRYMRWLAQHRGLEFDDYESLWRWSVSDLEAFWASIWDFFDVRAARAYERVLGSRVMPGAEWFTGAEINYAEHVLRGGADGETAILHGSESRPPGVETARMDNRAAIDPTTKSKRARLDLME